MHLPWALVKGLVKRLGYLEEMDSKKAIHTSEINQIVNLLFHWFYQYEQPCGDCPRSKCGYCQVDDQRRGFRRDDTVEDTCTHDRAIMRCLECRVRCQLNVSIHLSNAASSPRAPGVSHTYEKHKPEFLPELQSPTNLFECEGESL